MQPNAITVQPPRLRRSEDGRCELRVAVCDHDVAVRSSVPLAEVVDGAVCAFFLPALSAARRISSVAPVDRTLMDNLEAAARIAAEFWNFSGPLPEAPVTDRAPSGTTGAFFTGGVDSFYTLRTNLDRVRCLVNVHGFDIQLADRDRFARSRALLSQVAESLSLELVSVETDLRAHSMFRSISWEVTHVAALASVAHALAPVLSRIYVAGTDVPPPWGSHPSLDKLWSSAAVTLVNGEIDVSRLDKVKAIADWPPVHSALKVCWENRRSDLNCGVCEKCVRTQAQFAAIGKLGELKTFPPGGLAERIDALGWIKGSTIKQWRDIRYEVEDRRLQRAVDRLLRRSQVMAVPAGVLKGFGLTRPRLRRLTGGLVG